MKYIKATQIKISHTLFSVIFTTLLFAVCNAINLDKFVPWFYLGDTIDYGGLMALFIFGLCLYLALFILFAHRWLIKPLAIFFIISSAIATYFISKYNVAVDRTMIMNSIHTDVTEVTGLLSIYMLPYLFFLIILPIAVLAKVHITFQSPAKYLTASLLLFLMAIAIGVGALYTKYNSLHRAANLSNDYIIDGLVPINIIRGTVSALQRSIEAYYRKNKTPPVITGQVVSQDDLIVALVIGESSRQKNFSLYGYDRKDTNPVLSKIPNLYLLNGKAQIGSTILALPEILERKDIKLPAITSKLGIDTLCLVNYTLYDNCDAVGEIEVSNCGHGGTCYDGDVIPLLENNLKSYTSGYRLLILHLGGGSHGPKYRDRHPPEFQYFHPQCLEADVVNHCTLEQLYNSYDNTIRYTDHVLGEIIQRLDQSTAPYVFIYLSDHGESLMENGRIFHGMPPGIPLPPEQAQIPLIVKSSLPVSIVARDEYHQQDVFDTILDLFTIESDLLDRNGVFIKK